jgi:hypothetical protein
LGIEGCSFGDRRSTAFAQSAGALGHVGVPVFSDGGRRCCQVSGMEVPADGRHGQGATAALALRGDADLSIAKSIVQIPKRGLRRGGPSRTPGGGGQILPIIARAILLIRAVAVASGGGDKSGTELA